MEQQKLKTAILGLGEHGKQTLGMVADSELFDLCAVADNDAELAEKTAITYECKSFFDYRQLVVQNHLDIVIACEPAYACIDFIRSAMAKGCNIIKASPAALDFEQAHELFGLAEKHGVKFFAANAQRYSEGYKLLAGFIAQHGSDSINLISAVCNVKGETADPKSRWLTDPGLAGGGVLLHDCYPVMDQITMNFDIPEKVYCLTGNDAPDKQQRLLTTEDTAVITMQYGDVQTARIMTSRTFGPYKSFIQLHTKDQFITADTNSFVVSNNNGEIISEENFDTNELDWQKEMLEDFAISLLNPNTQNPAIDTQTDLKAMAVIQACYLSAKTAMPEEPLRILEMVGP